MLIFLTITYIFLHQFVNRKFVDGYVGKRYGIYNLVLATSSLIAFFAIKIYEEEGGLGSVFLFLTFLLVYNLVFVINVGNWPGLPFDSKFRSIVRFHFSLAKRR